MKVKQNSSFVSKLLQIPRSVIIGVAGVVLAYVGVAGIISAAYPWWFGAGDTPMHIDYIWSVHKGELPSFEEGITYEPIKEVIQESGTGDYFIQSASQHPPLFYYLHSFLLGPLLEEGRWHSAIALGRFINVSFGVLAIFSLAWAGWVFGGKRREIFAIAVPALGVLTNPFVTLNISYSSDSLLVFFSAIGITSAYKIFKNGFSKKYMAILLAASVLGMLTKVTYVIVLAVALLFVVAGPILSSAANRGRSFLKGVLASTVILAAVAATSLWFYYTQNYQATGDWTRSGAQDWISYSRPYKSLSDVLFGRELISLFPAKLFADKTLSLVVSFALLFGGVYWLIRDKVLNYLRKDKKALITVLLMCLLIILAYATQVVHAVGYGGFYFRYLMPALVPLCLMMTYGALAFRFTKGLLVAIIPSIMVFTTLPAVSKSSLITNNVENIGAASGVFERLIIAFQSNQVWAGHAWILLSLILVGLVLLFVGVWSTNNKIEARVSY